jgi:hypothetical protein
MKIAVIRSVYGGYDHPIPVPPQRGLAFEEYLVHDLNYPRPHMHPRLAAKHAKCLPWQYTDADMIVWMDGSFDIRSQEYLSFLVSDTEGHLISQHKHPWRDDVLDEAEASAVVLKYQDQPVHAQAGHYLAQGHPRHWGMWSTGLAVYRIGSAEDRARLDAFGKDWLAEQVKWTYQDQISQPYILRLHGLLPHEINDDIYASPYLWMHGHRRED